MVTPTKYTAHGVLRGFAECTTMHGVPRIIKAHSLPARIFWAVICIGAFVMFFWQTAILMQRYLSYPKKVNMEIIQKPVPFPAVTVCNTDFLDVQVVNLLEKMLIHNQNISDITDIIDNDTWLNRFYDAYNSFLEYAVLFLNIYIMNVGDLENSLDDMLEVNSRLGMTANMGQDLASRAGVKLEDFIISCQFMSYDCQINTSFIKVFDPYYYNCFTFQPETLVTTRNTRLQGVEYGLSLLLFTGSAGQFHYDQGDEFMVIPGFMESNSALSSGRSARLVVHSPGTRPQPTFDGFDIAQGFSVTIGVKGRENVRIGYPHGNCTPHETRLKGEDSSVFNYTLIQCQNECIQSKIMKTCGCVDNRITEPEDKENLPYCFELPQLGEKCVGNLSTFGPVIMDESCLKLMVDWKRRFNCRKELLENITIKDPGALDDCEVCHPPCHDIIYDTSYSLSTLPDTNSKEASDYYLKLDYFAETFSPTKKKLLMDLHGENFTDIVYRHVSRLNVHISDSNIIKTTEQPDYEAIRLVSDIGGQLGLWIGISVITLFEVLQVSILVLYFMQFD